MMLFHLIDVDNKTDLKSPQRWHIYESLKMTGRDFFFFSNFKLGFPAQKLFHVLKYLNSERGLMNLT